MVRRILAVTGRVLIVTGSILLLFVLYQLWGTGLQTKAAQDRLANTFDEQVAAVTSLPADDPVRAETAAASIEALQTGDPVGRLEIPAIGVDYIVLEGVDLGTLESGPGHFPETPLPGQPGNSAIAGHRATFDAPFNLLDELVPGDEVRMTTLQGTFTYEVLPQPALDGDPAAAPIGHYLVSPTAIEILADKGDNRITLMGCHPRWGSSQRIVVEAKLVSTPAAATPIPSTATDGATATSADELLRGEQGGWGPVVIWGAIVLALGVVAMLVGRRFPRWIVYPLAAPFIGIALFRAFEAVSALSPVAY